MIKLRDLPPLPENALLCTIDVVGLYPSIPHEGGLQAMREALDGRVDKSVSTETLMELAELVLKNNYFEHNDKMYNQLRGTAIGTKFAPPYAILFLERFEDRAIENYNLRPWVWWRYIDGCFLIWEHGEEALKEFISYLNDIHPSIKFTFKYSRDSIEFLDVLVSKERDSLSTDLFVKETDTHQYLHYNSCHPFHTKKGIPYGQALRIRRICSDEGTFTQRISKLRDWLFNQSYDRNLIETQINKVLDITRETALSNDSRSKERERNRDYLVATFHPALSRNIYNIVKENHNILLCNEEHKKVFPVVPLISFFFFFFFSIQKIINYIMTHLKQN